MLESQDSRVGQIDSSLRDIPVYCHLKRVKVSDGDFVLEINYIFFLACAPTPQSPQTCMHSTQTPCNPKVTPGQPPLHRQWAASLGTTIITPMMQQLEQLHHVRHSKQAV